MPRPGFFLVAVHGGAGYHSEESEGEVRKAMRLACKCAVATLQDGSAALDAVETSIVALEDDWCLNAGCGSNLTIDGTVECDASIMNGRSCDFGSVGAVSGVKNPICTARAVLDHSLEPDPLGRIRPTMLVSSGAHAFAQQRDIPCVPPNTLTCDRARDEWQMWRSRLDSSNSAAGNNTDAEPPMSELHKRQDTVGAIAWDSEANLAAGVSSGGLLLKHSGRVGEAAVYGAGCWAQQSADGPVVTGVACSMSGSGEYIIREMLARRICEDLMESPEADTHEVLHRRLEQFQKRSRAWGEPDPIAGVLLLVKEADDNGIVHTRLWCGFTSHSMAIAYASSLDPKPKATVLRRPSFSREDTPSVYITALSLTR